MEKEIFKFIPGYPKYMVSNKGRIWNIKSQKYMKPSQKSNGYFQINLDSINGKRKKEYVHRLVAITFIDNPNHLPEVDHIDRDRSNNCVENLRWVSHSENVRNSSLVSKVKIYNKNNELLFDAPSVAEAAEFCGCHISSIYDWLEGRCKSRKGFIVTR